MKKPTLEEVHPPLADAENDLALANAKAGSLRAAIMTRSERVRSNKEMPGNQAINKIRTALGQDLLAEVLPDREQLAKDSRELAIINSGLHVKFGVVQRHREIASAKLCATVAPEYKALVKDVASKFSALHASLTKKYNFLDEVESTGASTTALNPISPNGLHPRDTSGVFHWVFKEMREHGHISMQDIPEIVR
jgi:hypothetical protein